MRALSLTLFVGLFIVAGIVLGNILKKNKKFNDLSIGLAIGVMVFLLVFDILPESYELLSNSISSIAVIILIAGVTCGFVGLKLLDKFVPHHEHEALHHHHHNDLKCHNEHLEHVGILATVALLIHNVIEGMTLYITANQDYKSGVLLMLAIGLHNIPLGIIVSNTLQTKKEIITNGIILSLSTFIGGFVAFLISNVLPDLLVGILLSITIGMIMYIVFAELLPQIVYNKEKKYNFIGVILGIILIIVSTLLG